MPRFCAQKGKGTEAGLKSNDGNGDVPRQQNAMAHTMPGKKRGRTHLDRVALGVGGVKRGLDLACHTRAVPHKVKLLAVTETRLENLTGGETKDRQRFGAKEGPGYTGTPLWPPAWREQSNSQGPTASLATRWRTSSQTPKTHSDEAALHIDTVSNRSKAK